jgi:hypothetical protein
MVAPLNSNFRDEVPYLGKPGDARRRKPMSRRVSRDVHEDHQHDAATRFARKTDLQE